MSARHDVAKRELTRAAACVAAFGRGPVLILCLIWAIGHAANSLADQPLPPGVESDLLPQLDEPMPRESLGDVPDPPSREDHPPPVAEEPEPASPSQEPTNPLETSPEPAQKTQQPPVVIGGQYRVMFNAANFGFHPAIISDTQKSQTFFNQRFRTWLTVIPNENVEGYLQVQMGHNMWGEQFEFVKANVAPLFPVGDRVGIALRRGYLTYRNDSLGELRLGVQDWQDGFGQTLASSDWDFNVGGLRWQRDLPALADARMRLGWFALSEGDVQLADDAVLVALDVEWRPSEDRWLGAAAYYLPDHGGYSYPTAAPYASAWDVWLGVYGGRCIGPIPLNAFFLYNPGQRRELGGLPTYTHHGFATKLETGPLPIGPGTWSVQLLYATGKGRAGQTHSNEFRTIAQSTRDDFGAEGYWSYLVITSPHGPSDVNDLGVSLQNRGLGLFTVQTKYDYPILQRLRGAIAVGWLRSATPNPTSNAASLGTELANIFTYDFGGGLKADFGASVLFTGDFYKASPWGPRPDTLYEAFGRVQLEF